MWTIPLFYVRDALALKAARLRARRALAEALQLAGSNEAMVSAIRSAVCEAEIVCTTLVFAKPNAFSGPERAS